MGVRRPVWYLFVPVTPEAFMRRISLAAPTLLFTLSAFAILAKQSYYRPTLAEESNETWDRIDRRAYVALPDGRMALVHPRIDTDLSLRGIWHSIKESLNPLP